MKRCVIFAFYAICVICVFACSKDDNPIVPEETVIDYDALTAESIDRFLDFAKTPRPCQNLDKAREYLKNWCSNNGFQFNRDEYGNVWFDVAASKGCEIYPKIILQCHMDMICACETGLNPDYAREVGTPLWEGTLLKGSGINLGSDDGIGVGIALTVAKSDIPHGPLRILVTADEDCGMLGAQQLPADVLDAPYLINLDQEEIGIINNGCGGGIRVGLSGDFERASVGEDDQAVVAIDIDGLRGGHSGEDIAKGRLSAAVVLGRLIDSAVIPYNGKLISINCGTALGAIATNCSLSFSVDKSSAGSVRSACDEQLAAFRKEYPLETINYKFTEGSAGYNDYLTVETGAEVLNALFESIPMGAFEFSEDNPDHITKSNNIGIVTLDEGHLDFQTFARSDYNAWMEEMKEYYRQVAVTNSLDYTLQSQSPAWFPEKNNKLEEFTLGYYRQYVPGAFAQPCMGTLEPALFCQKVPGIQMISIGPDLTDVHTINEALHTETVKPLLQTLVQVLMNAEKIGSSNENFKTAGLWGDNPCRRGQD